MARDDAFLAKALAAVRAFSTFGPDDDDPWGKRDFGSLVVAGQKVLWKNDYYAPSLVGGSEDPAAPQKIERLLTIVVASEY